jgi:hypothetical protein
MKNNTNINGNTQKICPDLNLQWESECWHNSMFKIGGSTVCFSRYVNCGIILMTS